jgi:(E)-4-hydroxy-3-methylbut-2-enyl-diphosphate synthase
MMNYCVSPFSYQRLPTRTVSIGNLLMGGKNPIRIQSMTTTDTMDTQATVAQSIRMIEAGCELVRITAPSIKEARNLENIKNELRKRGYSAPLVADIHFTPNAAELAARLVEKVRVNPGNYADKKKFETIEYTDAGYEEELERIRERFLPLVKICKEYGTAMRIGCNHGSLSDRIMSRYGDTPLGMVESAMEFLRICRDENYHQIVLSMKASNPQVMVHAYRLLVRKMIEEFSVNDNPQGRADVAVCYPLHLGVTEAGDGEDGRIKSAVGIGTLLEDGLGDTIRVSLTEEPELELPVARMLVNRYALRDTVQQEIPDMISPEKYFNAYDYEKRVSHQVIHTGGKNVPRVIVDLSGVEKITPATLFACGYHYSIPLDKWNLSDQACDFIFTGHQEIDFEIPGTLGVIHPYAVWLTVQNRERTYPLMNVNEWLKNQQHADLNFIRCSITDLMNESFLPSIREKQNVILILETNNPHGMAEQRRFFLELMRKEIKCPVIIRHRYEMISEEELKLHAATDAGALLLDGLGDGILIQSDTVSPAALNRISFGILQATRTRISKTEYISCPSCGRTLFDLQETTARIRSRTEHLKGVKIGIMGCIVNGPGEMADADYGYVGTGPGRITLYKGKEVVKRNIPEEEAVDALIHLIREHGDWVEKPAAANA